MKKNQQTIDESMSKIKFMMNYDSSKTLIENTIVKEQVDEPTTVPNNCANSIDMSELESKLTQVANTVKKMNTAFMRMANGEPRAKLIYRNLKSIVGHNVYNEDFNECKTVEETIKEIWPKLFRDWFSAGESLEEELQQLIDSSYYRDGAIIQKYLKASIKLLHPTIKPNVPVPAPSPTAPTPGGGSSMGGSTGGYSPVAGTNEQPYKLGTSGAGIFKVQECLGFTGVEVDGKFGPKTQSKMMELAKQYVNGFTDADVQDICKMASARTNMRIADVPAPQPIPTQDQTIKSQVQMPQLGTKPNTTTLRPAPMQLSPLAPNK